MNHAPSQSTITDTFLWSTYQRMLSKSAFVRGVSICSETWRQQ